MHSSNLKVLVAALAFSTANALPTSTKNPELIGQLITTPTQFERYRKIVADPSGTKLLSGEELAKATIWDFDQDQGSIPGSQGGSSSGAGIDTFPYLIKAGLTANSGTIGPCGVLLPHVHPRANEFFISVDNEITFGTRLELGVLKDGAQTPEYLGKLKKNSGTLFPQGSVHFQVNDSPNCKSASFIAVQSSEDAGTTTILQEPVGNSTLGRRMVGKSDFEAVRPVTPPHIVAILDKCFERCNIE